MSEDGWIPWPQVAWAHGDHKASPRDMADLARTYAVLAARQEQIEAESRLTELASEVAAAKHDGFRARALRPAAPVVNPPDAVPHFDSRAVPRPARKRRMKFTADQLRIADEWAVNAARGPRHAS